MLDSKHVSMIAFSGTPERMYTIGILASGGVANGLRVDIFATFWGLLAIRRESGFIDDLVSRDCGEDANRFLATAKDHLSWKALVRSAKELGDVHVTACAMTMDLFHLEFEDFDPMVDDAVGPVEFMQSAKDGQILVF